MTISSTGTAGHIKSGVGLKAQHYRTVLDSRPAAGFFEVHAENFMGAGGPPHRYLEAIRGHYPLSIHGVGLNIGGSQPLDRTHLQRLKQLLDRYEAALFSEHLAWSSHGGLFLNDLLPLPYTPAMLDLVCNHIDETQAVLGRRMLLENPSTYVTFSESTMTEEAFIAAIARRTGCGLLLDVNNAYVSSVNQRRDPARYLDQYPLQYVEQFHLAGFAETHAPAGERLLIDTHGDRVHAEVWQLYADVVSRAPAAPTLVEWDNEVPELQTLLAEAHKADAIVASVRTSPGTTAMARAGGAR
jgi:uncharacterized protein (UPF0276 family)